MRPSESPPAQEHQGATSKAMDGRNDSPSVPGARRLAGDLRRRRAAADRLPPLPDGRRDPADRLPPQRAGFVIAITVDTRRGVALVRGLGAKQLILQAGHKPLWSGTGRGWCIDAQHVPDVDACAQLERRLVVVRTVDDGGGAR